MRAWNFLLRKWHAEQDEREECSWWRRGDLGRDRSSLWEGYAELPRCCWQLHGCIRVIVLELTDIHTSGSLLRCATLRALRASTSRPEQKQVQKTVISQQMVTIARYASKQITRHNNAHRTAPRARRSWCQPVMASPQRPRQKHPRARVNTFFWWKDWNASTGSTPANGTSRQVHLAFFVRVTVSQSCAICDILLSFCLPAACNLLELS